MGSWGFKVLQNDAALDRMSHLDSDNVRDFVKEKLLDTDKWNEHEIVLALGLVDCSINGPDRRILGGLYGYQKFLEDLPSMLDLVDECVECSEFLLSVEDSLGWTYPECRKAVVEQLLLRILLCALR